MKETDNSKAKNIVTLFVFLLVANAAFFGLNYYYGHISYDKYLSFAQTIESAQPGSNYIAQTGNIPLVIGFFNSSLISVFIQPIFLLLGVSLSGCGAVTGVASGAASIAGTAVDVVGTVAETSVDVVTAPLR